MENNEKSSFEPYPRALFDAVIEGYPSWLARKILEISHGTISTTDVDLVVAASLDAVKNDLAELLTTDVDAQRSNPLHVLRQSTVAANELLSRNGVQTPTRDEFEVSAMPHDTYNIGPLTWKDLGEAVHDAGISWGAWKAATVMMRRRDEGKIS